MRPRILLLMEERDRSSLESKCGSGGENFSFVKYSGKVTPEAARAHLQQHPADFDAVAVFVDDSYAPVRRVLEESFGGPKILVSYVAGRFDPQDVRQALNDGKYVVRVTLGQPSDFENAIAERFKDL